MFRVFCNHCNVFTYNLHSEHKRKKYLFRTYGKFRHLNGKRRQRSSSRFHFHRNSDTSITSREQKKPAAVGFIRRLEKFWKYPAFASRWRDGRWNEEDLLMKLKVKSTKREQKVAPKNARHLFSGNFKNSLLPTYFADKFLIFLLYSFAVSHTDDDRKTLQIYDTCPYPRRISGGTWDFSSSTRIFGGIASDFLHAIRDLTISNFANL